MVKFNLHCNNQANLIKISVNTTSLAVPKRKVLTGIFYKSGLSFTRADKNIQPVFTDNAVCLTMRLFDQEVHLGY